MTNRVAFNEFKETKVKQKLLEENIYKEIQRLFEAKMMYPCDNGVESGISDEDLLEHFFGKTRFSNQQIKLIKKQRQRYQNEVKMLIGRKNTSGEYCRFVPRTKKEHEEYMTARQQSIIGLMGGALTNLKNNYKRLGLNSNEEIREKLEFVENIRDNALKKLELDQKNDKKLLESGKNG